MAGQLLQYGAEFLANKFTGEAVPVIGTSAPGTWIVGQEWINTTSGAVLEVYDPHTTAWVAGPYEYYMATLTSDPSTSGPGGGLPVNISDVNSLEDTTPGYLRQPVTFAVGSAAEPSIVQNSNVLTFGPYTANQSLPVGYTALMAIPAAFTGGYVPLASTVLNGLLLYIWQVPNPQQKLITQSIQVAANTFAVGVS
jgi:hypothetical protein